MTNKAKVYAVKNDEGKFYDFYSNGDFWKEAFCRKLYTLSENEAQDVAHDYGGHVVELVEKPEPEAVSEKEAGNLGRALKPLSEPHAVANPFNYLAARYDSEEQRRLIRALVNGYTVAKEKRYNVKVPYTDDSYFYKVDDDVCNAGDSFILNLGCGKARFTEAEIQHYGLQDCERVEVTDDGE